LLKMAKMAENAENAENGLKCWKVAYHFKKIIKLTYLPAFFSIFQQFLAVSAIFSFRSSRRSSSR